MLKLIRSFLFILLALLVSSGPALARDFADIFSDCGIGAMIAPKNSGVAAVTNVTWDCGTTAISSNITSPDTCKGGQDRLAAFIYDSYDSLEKDLASGSGTYLDTLMTLAGLTENAKPEFAQELRQDFTALVAQPAYTDKTRFEKAEALFNVVYKHVDVIS